MLGALVLAVMGLLAVWLVARVAGGSEARLLADPAMYIGFNPLTGALSHAGVVAWFVAAGCALLGASVVAAGERARGLLVALGLLSAWLGLDDLFLLHESVSALTGTEAAEAALFAAYGLTAVAIAWRWRDVLRSAPLIVLAGSAGLLAFSVLIDVVVGGFFSIYEDGAKLAGVLLWSVFVTLTARRLLLEDRFAEKAVPAAAATVHRPWAPSAS